MKVLCKTDWSEITASADKKTAHIVIDGVIGFFDWWAEDTKEARKLTKQGMRKELKAIEELQHDTIIVHITSLGGIVDHALAIHDMLCAHKAHVITEITGMTASAATIISQAGDERRISENALMLTHLCLGCTQGNIHDLEASIEVQKKINERMAKLYAKRSGTDIAKITELMEANQGRGKWISSEEAFDFGLVDTISEAGELAACVSPKTPKQYLANVELPPVPFEYANRTNQQSEQNKPLVFEADEQHNLNKEINKMTPEQIGTLKARFGAEFALEAIQNDTEYSAALESGTKHLAAQLEASKALASAKTEEVANLTAKVTELQGKVEGQEDPLLNSASPAEIAAAKAEKTKTDKDAKETAESEADAAILAALNNGYGGNK